MRALFSMQDIESVEHAARHINDIIVFINLDNGNTTKKIAVTLVTAFKCRGSNTRE